MPKRISAQSAIDQADEVTAALEDEAHGTIARLRGQADELAAKLKPKVDAVADYVRDEPTKAVLISAAVGAGLMALIALATRPRSPRLVLPSSMPTTMGQARSAALDLAQSAQDMVTKAYGKAQKDAKKRLDQVQKDAASAANDASDNVSSRAADAWKSLRDQAAPMVEKIRPQLDAATAYLKEEPGKATLGVVAAGALLMGLLALVSGSSDD